MTEGQRTGVGSFLSQGVIKQKLNGHMLDICRRDSFIQGLTEGTRKISRSLKLHFKVEIQYSKAHYLELQRPCSYFGLNLIWSCQDLPSVWASSLSQLHETVGKGSKVGWLSMEASGIKQIGLEGRLAKMDTEVPLILECTFLCHVTL